ncbi:GNAT family N-acetyltransferase [Faecalibacillus faecis]|nr:GNAT family N-acetyltransferase [Faecalibacillus faecis]
MEGFLSFKVNHYLHHDRDTGEIVELVVFPEKRSLKIGKQLIEKIARNKKFEQIELSTSTYRKDAHRFYERQGYEKLHYNYTKDLDD